jgi:hypothetical protein
MVIETKRIGGGDQGCQFRVSTVCSAKARLSDTQTLTIAYNNSRMAIYGHLLKIEYP